MTRWLACAWLLGLLASQWCAAESGPLMVRNQMPVAQLYGLPRASGADFFGPDTELGSDTRLLINFEATNNFANGRNTGDEAVHDGESYLTTLAVSRAVGQLRRFEVGVAIPYVAHAGGRLDGFIDGFHDLFGFPDSGRSEVARGLLDYRVRVDGSTYADIQDGGGHLGDIRAWLGYQVFRGVDSALAVRSLVKVPTGRVSSLSGSGGTDVAIWAEYANARLLRSLHLEMSLMAGAVVLGKGNLAPNRQRDVAGFVHFGLQLPLGKRVRLHGQLDAHTELVDAAVQQIGGSALQGTLGGRITLSRRLWLDLGVVENLTTKSAPDVTFQILLGSRF